MFLDFFSLFVCDLKLVVKVLGKIRELVEVQPDLFKPVLVLVLKNCSKVSPILTKFEYYFHILMLLNTSRYLNQRRTRE